MGLHWMIYLLSTSLSPVWSFSYNFIVRTPASMRYLGRILVTFCPSHRHPLPDYRYLYLFIRCITRCSWLGKTNDGYPIDGTIDVISNLVLSSDIINNIFYSGG